MEQLSRLATYPFMPEAQEWIKKEGVSLDDMLHSRAYANARARGKRRLLKALEKERVWTSRFSTDLESINELLSYIVARILISVVGDRYLIRRFALAEGERINKALMKEDMPFVLRIASCLGMDVDEVEHEYVPEESDGPVAWIHFLNFLRYTSQMRSTKWKLVNMDVKDGRVLLEKERLCRIIQEVVRRKFEEELPLPINENIKEAFEGDALEILDILEEKKKSFGPDEMGEVKGECFPPCIMALIAQARRGENISHMGRFTLASFLHTVGMSNEEILGIFVSSPDFREDLAMYQIDHITGVTSGTEYTPPECTTMVTFGLCVNKDRLCDREWMTHSLKYYRAKCRSLRRKKGGKKDKSEMESEASEEE